MLKPQVLLIGTLDGAASQINAVAHENNIKVIQAAGPETAINILCDDRIDMTFFDASEHALPAFFVAMNEAHISIPLVAVGPANPVQNAVKAIRLGAIEYISTPADKELVSALLEKIKPVEEQGGPIAGDIKTFELLDMAKKFAQSNATVLLRGESGVGKEVYSKYIQQNSQRKDKPFISINCAAIPEHLLESELFGHEKGAFSGALSKRLGKFQQADKGTLMLDEISEMDLGLQAKLLRAIQERVIDPVGAAEPVEVDIRLIATTNRALEDYVREGKFREDLYFRLNVVMLEIPPLRERVGDIEPLSHFFVKKYGEQNGLPNITLSPKAVEKLNTCYWKGNVRELENTIHRAVLMMGADSTMGPEHILISPMSQAMMSEQNKEPAQQASQAQRAAHAAGAYSSAASGFEKGIGTKQAPSEFVGQPLSEVEKQLIISTLNYCGGNRSHAADILGISIRTLRNKLKEYQESGEALADQGEAEQARP